MQHGKGVSERTGTEERCAAQTHSGEEEKYKLAEDHMIELNIQ